MLQNGTGRIVLASVIVVCMSGLVALSLILNRPLPEIMIGVGASGVGLIIGYFFGKNTPPSGPGTATP